MCFILQLAPCFVATARALLLSAPACIRNDSPISFRRVVRNSTQLTVHPTHTVLILQWTRQQFPVLDLYSSGEIDQRNSGMIVPFPSTWLVRKSTQLTGHQEHTFLILHWTRHQSPVLDIHSSREIDQRHRVQDVPFLVTGPQPSQHQNM